MTPPLHIAFIDDDPDLLAATVQSLELAGFEVTAFNNAQEALEQLPPDYPGAVISDIRMPGMNGIDLFRLLRTRDPELPVILITGHGTIAMAVQAMQEGAYDFLTKPYAPDQLLTAAQHATPYRRRRRRRPDRG
ncbi:DNA-binding NtrC family response regulator [Kerstersia gyiorum]|nr:DNA-binding NtrC family response regulator [Kerstersia gyiorum]